MKIGLSTEWRLKVSWIIIVGLYIGRLYSDICITLPAVARLKSSVPIQCIQYIPCILLKANFIIEPNLI